MREVSIDIGLRPKEALQDKLERLLGDMLDKVVLVNQESILKSSESPRTPRTPSPYEDF